MTDARFDGMDLGPALEAVFGRLPDGLELTKLKGDASTRQYYRVRAPGAQPASMIVMRLPAGDAGAKPGTELPFVHVQRLLAERSVRVPRILKEDCSHGVLLLEDLGDETFEARLRSTPLEGWVGLYEEAVSLLARMHETCRQGEPHDLPYTRSFDGALLTFELEHFRKWGLLARGLLLSDAENDVLTQCFKWLCEQILSQPFGFTHRDYQSRNLMWHQDELVVIDFQDALQGPIVYDLVALLCDSYVWLELPLVRHLIAQYARLRGLPPVPTERAFWQVAVQRKLKDAGRFVFIDQVRGNPDFLRWVVPSLRHVARALHEVEELRPLQRLLIEKLPGFPDQLAEPERHTGTRPGASM